MTRYIKIAGILLFASILLATCTYKANEPDICFSQDIQPIFSANCVKCHGASGGYNFATYEGILKGVVKNHPMRSPIYKAIKGNTPKMPPAPHKALTDAQISTIKAWISMGATNSSSCGSCDTSLYKFSAHVQPIFNLWCTGTCHTASSPDGGFNLSNHTGIKACGQSGMLMTSIKHSGGSIPMPSGGGKLSDCDIAKIQNWVTAGYPNN